MKRKAKPGLGVIEEAFMLLRETPLHAWIHYYLGTLPFAGALLFYLQFMSQSTNAFQYLTWASFFLALIYIWMKSWQSIFTADLLAVKTGVAGSRPTVSGFLRIFGKHAGCQWWATVMFLLAIVVAIPFSWINAFCQSKTVLIGMENEPKPKTTAINQAFQFSKQHHAISVSLLAFGFFVTLNVLSGAMVIPYAMKTLLGMDTSFSMAGFHLLNTSFLSICGLIAYVLIDPLIKATFTLRVFYLRSQTTGEDLLAQTRMIHKQHRPAKALGVVLVLCLFHAAVFGSQQASSGEAPDVSPENLAVQIEKVMGKAEYSWRMPREKMDEGAVDQFFRQISDGIISSFRSFGDWIKSVMDQLEDWLNNDKKQRQTTGSGSMPMDSILLLLVIVVFLILVFFLIRSRMKKKQVTPVEAAPPAAVVNLESEEVVATDLPENEWLTMARDYLESGDLRLAMRAYFLALLAMLEDEALIKVTAAKSNMDYLRELMRRHHAFPGLCDDFKTNMRLFEKAWYGLYPVMPDELEVFEKNRERMGHLVQQ